jgi:NAD+ diphosphatase
LRTSSVFINTLLASTSTRWVAFHDGKPLIASRATESRLALLTTDEVEHFLGPKPYFGQGPSEGAIAAVDLPILEAARFRGAPIVFLGLSEPQPNDYSPAIQPEELAKALIGTPFFSIDISEAGQTELDRLVQTSAPATDGYNLSFAEPRGAMRGMGEFDAGVFAEARSMVDWNFRNKVRGGQHRFVVFHRSSATFLSSALPVVHAYTLFGEDGNCHVQASSHRRIILEGSRVLPSLSPSFFVACSPISSLFFRKGLHNIAHPRTDAVVIMAVLNKTQDKILLGRNVGH